MYHYLVDALKGGSSSSGPVEQAATRGRSGTDAAVAVAASAADEARRAQQLEDERRRQVLQERRQAYTAFMTSTSLGQLLAPHMPAAGEVAVTEPASPSPPSAAPAPVARAAASDAAVTSASPSASPSALPLTSSARGPRRVGRDNGAFAHTELAQTMCTALAPFVSCTTALMTQRVFTPPHAHPSHPLATAADSSAGELVSSAARVVAPSAASQHSSLRYEGPPCTITRDDAAGATLPFLLIVTLLSHWHACLTALSTLTQDGTARASAPRLRTLQQLCHIVAALTCVTDLQPAHMRLHLDLLGAATTACVVETLQCLRRLTHLCGSEELAMPTETESASTGRGGEHHLRAEGGPGEASSTLGEAGDNAVRGSSVAADAVEVQACRLLSLLLYWMHLINGIEAPSLTATALYLSASSATHLSTASGLGAARSADQEAAAAKESRRCTGLSNAALVGHTHLVCTAVPMEMLSLAHDAHALQDDPVVGGGSQATSASAQCAAVSASSSRDVASSLASLLLSASKGVVGPYAAPNAGAPSTLVDGAAEEEDADLGLLVVLSSRLLRHMFAASTAPPSQPDLVSTAASSLLSALSILLARFIAGDREQNESDGAEPHVSGESAATPATPLSSSRRRTVEETVDPVTGFGYPPSPPSPTRSRHSSAPAVAPSRQLRLLGQLSSGLVLVTTLLEQNATSVLDTMDHSFFFDALVTALQVIGTRFTAPTQRRPVAATAAAPLAPGEWRCADAWLSWVGEVEAVAASSGPTLDAVGATGGSVSVTLSRALTCVSHFSFDVLSCDPYVDEFLHGYLGLLAASRLLRVYPCASTSALPRTASLGSTSTASSGVSGREVRAGGTLDQLELTLVKTFLTAYDASAELAAAVAAATTELSSTLPPLDQTMTGVEAAGVRSSSLGSGGDGWLAGLSFPFASCLYKLLLKHVFWCLEAAERRLGVQAFPPLLPPPAPPSSMAAAPLSPQQGTAPPLLRLSPGPTTAASTPRLSTQPPPSPSMLSLPRSPWQGPELTAAPGLAAYASHGGGSGVTGQDCDPLTFLVRHGLFRILLHDHHFAPAFTTVGPTGASEDAATLPRERGSGGEAADRAPPMCERSHAVLYLLAHCLQIRPIHGGSCGCALGSMANSPTSTAALPPLETRAESGASAGNVLTGPSPRDQRLAQETGDAIVVALRTATVAAPFTTEPWLIRPLAEQRRRRQWHDCLAALLATAVDGPRRGVVVLVASEGEAPQRLAEESSAVVPAASASVSAAVLRAGGVELLLRAALASAGAVSRRSHGAAGASATAAATAAGAAISYTWAMQATQCLATDPAVRIHLSTNCTKSLVLPLLWHPLLRAEGQRLLQVLLCQPLTGAPTSAEADVAASLDAREMSPSFSSSSGLVGGSNDAASAAATAAAGQAVPRHCRRLCEGVWRILCDCVNGPVSTSSEADVLDGAVSDDDNAEERHLVLRAVLRALVTAFRTLDGLRRDDGDAHAGELLPLRTLQRGLFEVSMEAGLNLYVLLMHRLAQSWKALDSYDSGGESETDGADETVSGGRIAAWAGGLARTPADSTTSFRAPDSVPHSAVDTPTATPTEASAAVRASLLAPPRSAREMVRLIVMMLVGMTQANPTQRELLYQKTVDEDTLLDCIANAWGASSEDSLGSSETSPFVGPVGGAGMGGIGALAGDVCGLVQVCSYLVYEAVGDVDDFFNEDTGGARGGAHARPWRWSLQNPLLLAALLRRFVRLAVLAPGQQTALEKLLTSLARTVEGCYASLYLAASSAVHDVLEQLLPVLALLPEAADDPNDARATAAPSAAAAGTALQLNVVLVQLLVSLTRCHVDVRQLKQLLVLVIHTRQQRDRRALVPLILQVLSEAAQPPPGAPLHHVVRRDPRHFVAFQRGRGPTGFRAALPDFPLEGYSVALNLRWEGEAVSSATAAAGDDPAAPAAASRTATAAAVAAVEVRHGGSDRDDHDGDGCSCLFSLRTTDRSTLLALMLERSTGRLFVHFRSVQQQEMRVYLDAVLPSRTWTRLCVLHRPVALLTAAAGGQLVLFVNGVEAAVVPQLAYPFMSRGYLYVGCLGNEVDRLSVAHAFYGQVSTAHFFPFVVTDRDREALHTVARLADAATWMSSSSTAAAAAAAPSASAQLNGTAGATANAASSSPGRRPAAGSPSAAESAAADAVGAEQWLAARAIVCVDSRLSDRGHLYNLSAVLRGRGGRDSRLFTLEGSVVCSTQRVMDSMGLLGALPSVVMPLCTLLVNPSLPISSRMLVAAPQHGSPAHRDPRVSAPFLSGVSEASTSVGASTRKANDSLNATVLRVLEMVPALASVEAIRNEMVEAGLFVFLGHVLQLLGPSLQVVVPAAFVQLLEAVAPFPRLFEDALMNLFLSADVIRAAPRAVQLTWVNVQRSFLRAHPDALPCLRSLGTSMFVAAELLRVTAEEATAEEGTEPEAASATSATPASSFMSPFASLTTTSPATGTTTQTPPEASPSCSLLDLEHQWMIYLEALTVAPVTLGDAEALQYFVENLHWTCRTAAVQLRLLRRVRHLLVGSRTPYLVQLLGRKNYVVSLIPYLSCATSEAVRLEALLQLLFMVLRSRRTQELMNPLLLASRETVVHVAEEVSLSWLNDVLQEFPVTLPVYMAFRCGLVERFDLPAIPTQYTPLDESHALRFAAVLLPLLMLLKRSCDATLRGYALTDLAVLLKSDTQAWRRVIAVRGWYVAVVGLFASAGTSLSSPTFPSSPSTQVSEVLSTPSLPPPPPTETAELRTSGLAFTTTSMIVAHTLFQVLLHETYGAAELELVVTYLRGQRLHRLLQQVLCGVTDRYRSRLSSPRGGGGRDAGVGRPAVSPTAPPALLGLGSAAAVVNLCHFLRLTELVIFYAGQPLRREQTSATQPAQSHLTPATSSTYSGGDGFVPQRTGYTEWEELMLVRVGDAGEAGDVYFAGEDADPHGNVRRAVLREPDGRWLHLPLAVKCAELLCTHSALLHLGSNGNTAGLVAGTVAGATTGGGSGGPGDALLSMVVAASGGTGLGGHIAGTASSAGGGSGSRGAALVLRGGMLRLFGRLFGVVCQMTLRDEAALSSIVDLTDAYLCRIDRDQRAAGFLVLKRAVSAEVAREHSPIATAMTVVRGLHSLLLRRLHAAQYGATSKYPNANAALVDRLKSVVTTFRSSFEQLQAFAASAATSRTSEGAPSARQRSSLQAATKWLLRGVRRRNSGSGGDTSHPPSPSAARSGSTYLQDLTGEVFTAGVPTLQWLCDPHANPLRTVEAFAEVASRVDYNVFIERCLLAVEREELTAKALSMELWPQQRVAARRLQELFSENTVSRRLVQEKIRTLMVARGSRAEKQDGGGVLEEGVAGDGNGDAEAASGRAPAENSTANSFTSLFLPSAARRATAAARANVWARFTASLRGTVWSVDAAYQQHTNAKYVRLSNQEQQSLVRRKLVYDRDGTNFSGRAMTLYSAPPSPLSNETRSARAVSAGAATVAKGDDGDDTNRTDSSTSTQAVSRLRLRGGEALLLGTMDDEDAGLEDDMVCFSLLDEDGCVAAGASAGERSLQGDEAAPGVLQRPASSQPGDELSAASSILSVPCEVPYMMHCWSGSFTVRGSEVIVLFDDDNKAYNQVVAEDARAFVLRPRPFSFHLSHVTQIAPGRRFRMRRTALEIWTRDRHSCFINFADTATMNGALQAVRRSSARGSYTLMASSFLGDAPGAATTAGALPSLLRDGAGGASRPSAYVLQENPRREPLRLRAMALWRNRQLSNFDYLLVLNLLAGRTVNDLTQYPVFPWILSDFTSETLDLTEPATFRDLSTPIGACGSEARREIVRQRYLDMRDLGDVPAHYFTHYSSPAIALYFLIRLPPFTTLSLVLQGGHFDHADRMFHAMQASYRAVTTSTQDVRELVPELYYLPELCINANRVDFGRRQDRTPMDDLHLPPWAHNDPFTFVYRMREALESEYVSAHLHEWIDLIFGYKQRGKEAIEALNVFNWHSYEELERNRETNAIDQQLLIDSLDNIGQTPIQLFRRPHQPRPPLEWADPLQLPTHVKVLTPRWGCARVARAMVLATDRVLVVSGSGAAASQRMHLNLIRRPATPVQAPGGGAAAAAGTGAGALLPPSVVAAALPPGVAAGPASSFAAAPVQGRGRFQGGLRSANRSPHLTAMSPGTSQAAAGPPPTPPSPAMMGRAVAPPVGDSGSFDVGEEYERRIGPIPAGVIPNNSPYADGSCTEASTTLLCYESEVFLVLGGLFDNSVVIRALSGAAGDVRLRAHRGRVLFVARSEDSRYIVTGAEDTTFAVWSCQLQRARQQLEVELLFVIYGHQDMPTAVDVSSTLDVVATASLDGTLMLHSLSTGSLDRVIRHPCGAPIHRILLQSTCYLPNIVFMSHQDERVYQYSLNGAALRTFTPPGRVTAWVSMSNQCLLIACHCFATGYGTPSSATPPRGSVAGESPSCILYLHAFFMEVLKTVPLRLEDVVSSVSAHPSHPQVAVAGTESGRLLLLRSVAQL